MDTKDKLLIFGIGFLLLFNIVAMMWGSKGFLQYQLFITTIGTVLIGVAYFLAGKFIDSAKPLSEGIRASVELYKEKMYGDRKVDVDLEVMEGGKYKENVHATKKGVVSDFVIIDKNMIKQGRRDYMTLVKDDPYIRDAKISPVFFTKGFDFMPVIYQSKAEIEKRPIVTRGADSGRRKMKRKIEEESEVVPVEQPVPVERVNG